MTASSGTVPRHLRLDGRPHRMTMGLRPLDLAEWLEVDEHRDEQLALKRRLLEDDPAAVLAVRPEGLAASAECLDLVVGWLAEHHPHLPRGVPADRHPIDAAGRLAQEDFCVLTRAPQGWVLAAASVCFPSRWALADKIGRTVAQIHEPVPGYPRISAAVDRGLDALQVDRPVWRVNWTIVPSPDLHLPPGSGTEETGLTVRVERQTLRRLPLTDGIVFTIHTHTAPLQAVVASAPHAERLRATLRSIDPDTAAYKGWTGLLPRLLAMLDERHAPEDTVPAGEQDGGYVAGRKGGDP